MPTRRSSSGTPDFTITRFNQAFERLSGYTASEVLGKDLSILFPADSREESLDKIKKTLEGEQWESVEIPILHKYGSVRIALWNSANIYGDDHTLLATIAQGQDITRRKQAEKELEEAKDAGRAVPGFDGPRHQQHAPDHDDAA